jgi:hypothetical protein
MITWFEIIKWYLALWFAYSFIIYIVPDNSEANITVFIVTTIFWLPIIILLIITNLIS